MARMYTSTMLLINIPVTLRQHDACEILEKLGKKFCVDYGYDNAEQKLMDYLGELPYPRMIF